MYLISSRGISAAFGAWNRLQKPRGVLHRDAEPLTPAAVDCLLDAIGLCINDDEEELPLALAGLLGHGLAYRTYFGAGAMLSVLKQMGADYNHVTLLRMLRYGATLTAQRSSPQFSG